MRKQELNCIWIGPPAERIDGGVPGHDLIGPMHLWSKINLDTATLTFWCLSNYLQHYQKAFLNTPVILSSIEELLSKSTSSAARSILTLKNRLLDKTTGRGEIKDNVTVKEAISLFILCERGGYVLDTNIMPIRKNKALIDFSHYDSFMVPAISAPTLHNGSVCQRIDVWMMYSPPGNSSHAEKALNEFLEKTTILEPDLFIKERYTQQYFDTVRNFITRAVAANPIIGMIEIEAMKDKIQTWTTSAPANKYNYTVITGPSVVKYYFNTHIKENFLTRTTFPNQVHFEALNGGVRNLIFLLTHGANIHSTINMCGLKSYTPLDAAISKRNIAIISVLLFYGADIERCAMTRRYFNEKINPSTQDAFLAGLIAMRFDPKKISFIKHYMKTSENTLRHHFFHQLKLFSENKKYERLMLSN